MDGIPVFSHLAMNLPHTCFDQQGWHQVSWNLCWRWCNGKVIKNGNHSVLIIKTRKSWVTLSNFFPIHIPLISVCRSQSLSHLSSLSLISHLSSLISHLSSLISHLSHLSHLSLSNLRFVNTSLSLRLHFILSRRLGFYYHDPWVCMLKLSTPSAHSVQSLCSNLLLSVTCKRESEWRLHFAGES